MSAESIFQVLYTAQKSKKAKVWQDGSLRIEENLQKAKLYDDKKVHLDTIFTRHCKVQVGETFETDRYLITVESVESVLNSCSQSVVKVPPKNLISSSHSRSIGIKRKSTGFLPPRVASIVPNESSSVLGSCRSDGYGSAFTRNNDVLSSSRAGLSPTVQSWPSPSVPNACSTGFDENRMKFAKLDVLNMGPCRSNRLSPQLWSSCDNEALSSRQRHVDQQLDTYLVCENVDGSLCLPKGPVSSDRKVRETPVKSIAELKPTKRNALQIIGLINKDMGVVKQQTNALGLMADVKSSGFISTPDGGPAGLFRGGVSTLSSNALFDMNIARESGFANAPDSMPKFRCAPTERISSANCFATTEVYSEPAAARATGIFSQADTNGIRTALAKCDFARADANAMQTDLTAATVCCSSQADMVALKTDRAFTTTCHLAQAVTSVDDASDPDIADCKGAVKFVDRLLPPCVSYFEGIGVGASHSPNTKVFNFQKDMPNSDIIDKLDFNLDKSRVNSPTLSFDSSWEKTVEHDWSDLISMEMKTSLKSQQVLAAHADKSDCKEADNISTVVNNCENDLVQKDDTIECFDLQFFSEPFSPADSQTSAADIKECDMRDDESSKIDCVVASVMGTHREDSIRCLPLSSEHMLISPSTSAIGDVDSSSSSRCGLRVGSLKDGFGRLEESTEDCISNSVDELSGLDLVQQHMANSIESSSSQVSTTIENAAFNKRTESQEELSEDLEEVGGWSGTYTAVSTSMPAAGVLQRKSEELTCNTDEINFFPGTDSNKTMVKKGWYAEMKFPSPNKKVNAHVGLPGDRLNSLELSPDNILVPGLESFYTAKEPITRMTNVENFLDDLAAAKISQSSFSQRIANNFGSLESAEPDLLDSFFSHKSAVLASNGKISSFNTIAVSEIDKLTSYQELYREDKSVFSSSPVTTSTAKDDSHKLSSLRCDGGDDDGGFTVNTKSTANEALASFSSNFFGRENRSLGIQDIYNTEIIAELDLGVESVCTNQPRSILNDCRRQVDGLSSSAEVVSTCSRSDAGRGQMAYTNKESVRNLCDQQLGVFYADREDFEERLLGSRDEGPKRITTEVLSASLQEDYPIRGAKVSATVRRQTGVARPCEGPLSAVRGHTQLAVCPVGLRSNGVHEAETSSVIGTVCSGLDSWSDQQKAVCSAGTRNDSSTGILRANHSYSSPSAQLPRKGDANSFHRSKSHGSISSNSKWDVFVDDASEDSMENDRSLCEPDGIDHLYPVIPTIDNRFRATDLDYFPIREFSQENIKSDVTVQSSSLHMSNDITHPIDVHATVVSNSSIKELNASETAKIFRQFLPPFSISTRGAVSESSNRLLRGDIVFPERCEVDGQDVPSRKVYIPVIFPDVAEYKRIFNIALKEHLNIQLFQLSKSYHSAMKSCDLSQYSPLSNKSSVSRLLNAQPFCESNNPPCSGHGIPSKIIQVRKEGPNKGRSFYACSRLREQQCRFFCWADDKLAPKSVSVSNASDIETLTARHDIPLYCECFINTRRIPKPKQFNKEANVEKKLFLKLSRKMKSSDYTKDDLWIISETLDFESRRTFLARSTFYGPMANSEVEIEPMHGFCASDWPNNKLCCALHACNAQTELSCLLNLNDYVSYASMPVLPYFLNRCGNVNDRRGKFSMPRQNSRNLLGISYDVVMNAAEEHIVKYNLNCDQATALRSVAKMFDDRTESAVPFITLVHGVFGSGKSFLLSVIVLFLVSMMELERLSTGVQRAVLVSSLTNVAVDRVLSGLLQLGFKDFARVGSAKKIAPSIIPYSVIQKNADLMNTDLSSMIKKAKVVGVTCAACTFSCMSSLSFPVVLLDECSQMTEPASLLPVARFNCHRLVLFGDPKQLDPTLQGSEASGSDDGLEQTLFDRLIKMGYEATMLKTQYRCHPVISGMANQLFYANQLHDGITHEQRLPLASGWPTLCFYDVANGNETSDQGGSFFNHKEAEFVGFLIESLLQDGVDAKNIGVVTLYRAQQSKITDVLLGSSKVKDLTKSIQISTVDAFQGAEREIIILSCVRSREVGFIDCKKRVNVALTRARHHLFIVGHRGNLEANLVWSRVIGYCQGLRDGFSSSSKFVQKVSGHPSR